MDRTSETMYFYHSQVSHEAIKILVFHFKSLSNADLCKVTYIEREPSLPNLT